jgi:hypothetical protein
MDGARRGKPGEHTRVTKWHTSTLASNEKMENYENNHKDIE